MKLILPIAMRTWVAGLKVVVSRCESCQKILALRHLSARKAGIRMHGSWYCSSRCFRLAAEQEVVRLLKPANGQAAYVARMPLGLNLISHGLVTIEQLKKATDEQKETGGEIGELLVRQGAVSEKQVTAIRAAEWGCPVFTIPKHRCPDWDQHPRHSYAASFHDSGALRSQNEFAVSGLRSWRRVRVALCHRADDRM